MSKIISITPAPPGWFALFRALQVIQRPVVLWALAQSGPDASATYPTSFSMSPLNEDEGMGLDAKPDDEHENFIGYRYYPPTVPR